MYQNIPQQIVNNFWITSFSIKNCLHIYDKIVRYFTVERLFFHVYVIEGWGGGGVGLDFF